ncbi:claudin-10 isoform X5 [Pleuronectes platessa]|uniref:claudin-10 isoform X5 n=1 Tax=Pleuronectes platessa TaxID=8262 RepID=UPI00232A6DC7|nr:claudin-10 isoform X5 [Pleuronectes platessa]
MSNFYVEIVAFILNISGWVLVCSTLPMDYWKVYSLDGVVLATATYWSNLWKTCVMDLTGVSDCKGFPSLLALDGRLFFMLIECLGYIHTCRGLMIAAVCLGFFGSAFALFGMKCTKIGGSERTNGRITCVAGVDFILSGMNWELLYILDSEAQSSVSLEAACSVSPSQIPSPKGLFTVRKTLSTMVQPDVFISPPTQESGQAM